jgi:hypothetical protein
MAVQQAGWYADPAGDTSKLRYWDGVRWTGDYTDIRQAQAVWPMQQQVQPLQPQFVAQGTGPVNACGGQMWVGQYAQAPSQMYADRGKLKAAFVLNLISTISIGWLLVPLAWMLPMTICSWRIYKGTKRNSTAFGVCTLLFVNQIGGILLLISDTDQLYVQAPSQPINDLATASLIYGIIGGVLCLVLPQIFLLVFVPSIVAIITGILGRKKIVKKRMATVGLVLGISSIALSIALNVLTRLLFFSLIFGR